MLYKIRDDDDRVKYIRERVDEDTRIMQAAEELFELSEAASRFGKYLLKYVRRKHSTNPTTDSVNKINANIRIAENDLYKELLDVYLCVCLAGFNKKGSDALIGGGVVFLNERLDRWKKRLEDIHDGYGFSSGLTE